MTWLSDHPFSHGALTADFHRIKGVDYSKITELHGVGDKRAEKAFQESASHLPSSIKLRTTYYGVSDPRHGDKTWCSATFTIFTNSNGAELVVALPTRSQNPQETRFYAQDGFTHDQVCAVVSAISRSLHLVAA